MTVVKRPHSMNSAILWCVAMTNADRPELWPVSRKNKRQGTRRRVLLSGKIVYRDGAVSLDCTILDLSDSGARIRIARNQAVPSRFYLINIRNRSVYDAIVAWLNPPQAGVRFAAVYQLGSDLPVELGYLRKLWLECAAR